MQQFTQSSYRLFIVIIMAASFLAAFPAARAHMKRTELLETASLMNKAQSDLILYDIDHNGYSKLCKSSLVQLLQLQVITYDNVSLQCSVSKSGNQAALALVSKSEGGLYCIDTDGFRQNGEIDLERPGYCSK